MDNTRGRELVEMRSRPCAPLSGLNKQNGKSYTSILSVAMCNHATSKQFLPCSLFHRELSFLAILFHFQWEYKVLRTPPPTAPTNHTTVLFFERY
jgi:hypothetical protein